MTYRELYEYGKKQLEDAGIEEAALDARLLLEYICHTDRMRCWFMETVCEMIWKNSSIVQ